MGGAILLPQELQRHARPLERRVIGLIAHWVVAKRTLLIPAQAKTLPNGTQSSYDDEADETEMESQDE